MSHGFAEISKVARIFERAGWSRREADEWEAEHIVKLSRLRKIQQAAEVAANMKFVAEVREMGTRVMAERGGVSRRAIRKRRAACLAKIGTYVTRTGSA